MLMTQHDLPPSSCNHCYTINADNASYVAIFRRKVADFFIDTFFLNSSNACHGPVFNESNVKRKQGQESASLRDPASLVFDGIASDFQTLVPRIMNPRHGITVTSPGAFDQLFAYPGRGIGRTRCYNGVTGSLLGQEVRPMSLWPSNAST